MKEPNDHIKKLFSEFEPEVSDAKIEEGWEKIRYFLPQEEKRRGLAWFWYAGVGGVLFLVSWLMLRTPSADQKIAKLQKKADQVELNSTPAHTPSAHKQAASDAADTKPLSSEHSNIPAAKQDQAAEHTSPEPVHPVSGLASVNDQKSPISSLNNNHPLSKAGTAKATGNGSSSQAPVSPIDEKNVHTPPFTKEQDPSVAGTAAPQSAMNDQSTAAFSSKKNALESNTTASVSSENAEVVLLSPVVYSSLPVNDSLPEPALAELRRLPWSPMQRRFGIQIFGGPAYMASSLNAVAFADAKQYNALGVSGGVALAYYFNSRFSAMAQLNFTKGALSYDHEIIQSKIVQVLPVSNLGTASVDTTVLYRKAYTESHFSMATAYSISFGAAYMLFKKGRVDLSASLYMSLRRSNYKFTEDHTLSAETYSGSLKDLPPAAPAGFPQAAQQLSGAITTTGLTPGLMLGCSIYRNLALIFRPSYLIQMSSGNNAVKDKFNLRQNTLYLDLGIRIRW